MIKRSVFLRYFILASSTTAIAAACDRSTEPEADLASAPAVSETPKVFFPLEETWQVVTATGYYPFVQQPQPDKFEGFDVDLLSAVGKVAGVGLNWRRQAFDSLIPTVQAGRAEVAIGAIAITAARAEKVSFSQPYFISGLAIATAADRQGLTSLKALEDRVIAVQLGTAGADAVIDISGSQIKTYSSTLSALEAVAQGSADAALVDWPIVLAAIEAGQISGIQLASRRLTETPFGIVVGNQSETKLAAINQALQQIKASGRYAELYQKWFGIKPQT
ncbi:MAG: transporter substrate-binding domain-containing protein [Leptolyngbya sp. SIO4C1]|nr:transporter substrate-binding domain-containing protein [Leptolyngbya sp. SIO4C1]